MPWPPETEPEDKLHEALFAVEEIRGHDEAIAFLTHELARLRIVKQLKTRTPLLAPPASPVPTSELRLAVEALDFYANPAHYEAGKSGKDRRSQILRDSGKKARDALAAVAHDGDGDQ